MAEKDYELEPYIKEYRTELAKVDEVGQMILNGHLQVEAALNEVLGAMFDKPQPVRKMRFADKVKIASAFADQEDEDIFWPIVQSFNAVRNTVAHGQDSEERKNGINQVRGQLQRFGDRKFQSFIATASEADIVTHAAALCRGFLLKVEYRVRTLRA
jgi:hypothetical protein